jgi:hypothetical protein
VYKKAIYHTVDASMPRKAAPRVLSRVWEWINAVSVMVWGIDKGGEKE